MRTLSGGHGGETGMRQDRGRNLLSVSRLQSRLVVEQVDMRGRSALPEDDDAFRLRREVRQSRKRRHPCYRACRRTLSLSGAEGGREAILLQQPGQRRDSDSTGRASKELAAGQMERLFKFRVHVSSRPIPL